MDTNKYISILEEYILRYLANRDGQERRFRKILEKHGIDFLKELLSNNSDFILNFREDTLICFMDAADDDYLFTILEISNIFYIIDTYFNGSETISIKYFIRYLSSDCKNMDDEEEFLSAVCRIFYLLENAGDKRNYTDFVAKMFHIHEYEYSIFDKIWQRFKIDPIFKEISCNDFMESSIVKLLRK